MGDRAANSRKTSGAALRRIGAQSPALSRLRFPDWLARFILRTAKNSKLSAERGFSEYLIDADAESNSPLVAFLTSFSRETVVLSLDPVDFVAELARRWQERQGGDAAAKAPEPGPMPEIMPPGSLFISYASEDRPAALRLAAELQDAGLPVWLDRQQLDWGSDYTARIRLAIQQCALFVPVLSRTAEQRTGFFRKEWAWASERNLDFTGSSLAFLCPLVIDDTPVVTSNEIPPAFKIGAHRTSPRRQPAARTRRTRSSTPSTPCAPAFKVSNERAFRQSMPNARGRACCRSPKTRACSSTVAKPKRTICFG